LGALHISVIDADSVAVSMANTITNYWRSGQGPPAL
jgi:gamma-glutamyltranspeptidase